MVAIWVERFYYELGFKVPDSFEWSKDMETELLNLLGATEVHGPTEGVILVTFAGSGFFATGRSLEDLTDWVRKKSYEAVH